MFFQAFRKNSVIAFLGICLCGLASAQNFPSTYSSRDRLFVKPTIVSPLLDQTRVKRDCNRAGDRIAISTPAQKYFYMPNEQLFSQNDPAEISRIIVASNGLGDVGLEVAPWLMMNSSNIVVRKAAFLTQKELFSTILKAFTHNPNLSLENYFATITTSKNLSLLKENLQRENKKYAYFTHIRPNQGLFHYDYDDSKTKGQAIAPLLCLQYGFTDCYEGFHSLFNITQPFSLNNEPMVEQHESWRLKYTSENFARIGNVNFLLPTVMQEVLTDPKYVCPAMLGAQKLLARVSLSESTQQSQGSIWSDLKEVSLQCGNSPLAAEEIVWKMLGFYSIRGASMSALSDLVRPDLVPMVAAFGIISAAMSELDLFPHVKGETHLYTLPPGIQSSCAYGKPYHFWMAAYLAHALRKEGFQAKGSFQATHLMGMMYEMTSTTYGRTPYKTIATPKDSDYNNSIRLSLVMNDAGAAFGSEMKQSFLIDHLYLSSYSHGRNLKASALKPSDLKPAESRSKFENLDFFLKWNKVLAPESYIEFLSH